MCCEKKDTHTTILHLCEFCPGQPGWAGTKRNIHPLTLIVVISHPSLLSPSTTIHGILRIQSTCFTVFFHNLSPSEKKTMIGWSMKWRVPSQQVDQSKLGQRLWKKTVRYINWTERMLQIVIDRGSRLENGGDGWWPWELWVGNCFFWYRLTRVALDKTHRAVKLYVCVLSKCLSVSLYVCVCT